LRWTWLAGAQIAGVQALGILVIPGIRTTSGCIVDESRYECAESLVDLVGRSDLARDRAVTGSVQVGTKSESAVLASGIGLRPRVWRLRCPGCSSSWEGDGARALAKAS
jgi:hypothetical protein